MSHTSIERWFFSDSLKINSVLIITPILLIHFGSLLINFNFFSETIFTFDRIYYDFSGSWRIHVNRILAGESLYYDFEYTYPPLGILIISGLFYFVENNIFHQSLISFSVFSLILIVIYKISQKLVPNQLLRYLSFTISVFLIHACDQEISLGGNPFPLWLGFLFLTWSYYFFLLERINTASLLALLSASCKHEFWIPCFVILIFCLIKPKTRANILSLVILISGLNFILGFNSLDIIFGLGRAGWGRGQFVWETASISIFLLSTCFIFKNRIALLMIITLASLFTIFLFNPLNFQVGILPFFLFSLIFFYKSIYNDKSILLFFLILIGLQIRRGFEFPEPTYLVLLPIFFGLVIGKTEVKAERLLALGSFIQILLISISLFSFTLFIKVIRPFMEDQRVIHNTALGKIVAPSMGVDFKALRARIEGKKVVCLPFCSGVAVLTGSTNSWPLQYFYRRDRIRSFDYYEIDTSNNLPDYFLLDTNYLTWKSYPDNNQMGFLKWKLKSREISYTEEYPEIFAMLDSKYKELEKNGIFILYELKKIGS